MSNKYLLFEETWRAHHPDWEFKLWTEKNMPPLRNQRIFDLEPTYAGKSDIARIELLYNFGGVYIDTDLECLGNIEHLIQDIDAFGMTGWTHDGSVKLANGFMGSIKEYPLWAEAIDRLESHYMLYRQSESLFKKTGADLLNTLLPKYGAKLLPQVCVVEPIYDQKVSPETIAIHYAHGKDLGYRKQPKIDFLSTAPHYFDHLYPVWEALPDDLKGTFYVDDVPFKSSDRIRERGIDCVSISAEKLVRNPNPIVVAGLNPKLRSNPNLILLNHGAGQTYLNKGKHLHQSFSGGPDRDNILLFLNPNKRAYEADLQAYPLASHAMIGCPKIDSFLKKPRPSNDIPVVAISFHFDSRVCEETRTSFPYYKDAIAQLSREPGIKLLGHGHPRIIDDLIPFYEALGVEIVRDFEEVIERADLYVCDNSSTIFEFASTDRPVLLLNSPWYRKDVEHGLRFWEHADIGIQCDYPADLPYLVRQALDDPEEIKLRRREHIKDVYAVLDGTSSQKAVEAILELLDKLERERNIRYYATLVGASNYYLGRILFRKGVEVKINKSLYERLLGSRYFSLRKEDGNV